MLSPTIETERLILRRYKESDIDAIYEIITDERLNEALTRILGTKAALGLHKKAKTEIFSRVDETMPIFY